MNMTEIKAKLGLGSLAMVQQFEDEAKTVPAPWVSHWDNEKRLRVTMHSDVLKTILANPDVALALKKQEVEAHKTPTGEDIAAYTRYIVITPANVVATF